jgi:energy-converting hydrogenase Eha subunit A
MLTIAGGILIAVIVLGLASLLFASLVSRALEDPKVTREPYRKGSIKSVLIMCSPFLVIAAIDLAYEVVKGHPF